MAVVREPWLFNWKPESDDNNNKKCFCYIFVWTSLFFFLVVFCCCVVWVIEPLNISFYCFKIFWKILCFLEKPIGKWRFGVFVCWGLLVLALFVFSFIGDGVTHHHPIKKRRNTMRKTRQKRRTSLFTIHTYIHTHTSSSTNAILIPFSSQRYNFIPFEIKKLKGVSGAIECGGRMCVLHIYMYIWIGVF
jgi:hypothetical protein